VALMTADLNQNLRVDSGQPLAFHQLIQVAESHWYWYQRYHHLVVDGFSFPAITRQIAAIYTSWKNGEPTPESPFTPFAEVVEEYQRYRDSEAYQRDGAFWAEQRKAPSPFRSSTPLPGRAATTDILRLNMTADSRAFSQLAQAAGQCSAPIWRLRWWRCGLGASPDGWTTPPGLSLCAHGVRRADRHRTGTQCPAAGGKYPSAGEPSRAGIAPGEPVEKMRRHQRYDAEQIVRDSGAPQATKRCLARC
jgi:enterobactin synthetase component F